MLRCICFSTLIPISITLFLISSTKTWVHVNNFIQFCFTDVTLSVALAFIVMKQTAYTHMVSYTGNILGIQNQIIPFGALSIRWNKLQSLLVTTVMNDSFQFTTCQYKCNLLWLPLSFLIYNIGNSKLALLCFIYGSMDQWNNGYEPMLLTFTVNKLTLDTCILQNQLGQEYLTRN